ncbi:hypothetical protein V6615_03385 [Oscillospiraceae bacterium PP1C4]
MAVFFLLGVGWWYAAADVITPKLPEHKPEKPEEIAYLFKVYEQVGVFASEESARAFAVERKGKTIVQLE